MTVAYGATGAGNSASTSFATNTSTSWSHTIAAGDNCVVVAATIYSGVVETQTYTCTYGGTNMTLLTTISYDTHVVTNIYYMLNPPTGAQTVACSGSSATQTGREISGNSVSYSGVGSVALLAATTGSGGTATLSGLVTGAADIIFFALGCWAAPSGNTFTQRSNISNSVYPNIDQQIGDSAGATTSGSSTPGSGAFATWGFGAVQLRSPSGNFFPFMPM